MRTASRLNSSLCIAAISGLLDGEYCSQKTGSKLVQVHFACPVGPAPDPFAFEQIEGALGDCVVVTVAAAAHRMLKIVGTQECGPIHAGELTALIRMDSTLFFGFRRQTAIIRTCRATSVV